MRNNFYFKVLVSALITAIAASPASAYVYAICKGVNSKVKMTPHQSYGNPPGVVIRAWTREYERAQYPDLFEGFVEAKNVKTLLAQKNIKTVAYPSSLTLKKIVPSEQNPGPSLLFRVAIDNGHGRKIEDVVDCSLLTYE
ncbi:MAG: hypothetical protein RJB66_553 [Pseudomonadota bacterium]|jgi:hypothetical protein